MARGNKIVLTPQPRGIRKEGIISGALLPGTVVQLASGVAEDAGNRFTWQAYDKSGSGAPGIIAVLDMDWQQGKLATDAYVSGKRGFIYFPLPGDELNMLIHDQSGTGASSDFLIGDYLQVEDATGKLLHALTGTGPYLSVPFMALENFADLTADYLMRTMFTGY